MAGEKLEDARLLLDHGRYSNAYYLAGYAVEIGLKACIARQFGAEAIPDRSFVNAIYSHNFRTLVNLAGLAGELKDREAESSAFAANWVLVNEWTPEARYAAADLESAQVFVQAVSDATAGVFPWIRTYW